MSTRTWRFADARSKVPYLLLALEFFGSRVESSRAVHNRHHDTLLGRLGSHHIPVYYKLAFSFQIKRPTKLCQRRG